MDVAAPATASGVKDKDMYHDVMAELPDNLQQSPE